MLEAILGIDIGKEGGISILSKDGKTLYDSFSIPIEPLDIMNAIRRISERYVLIHCYVEKQAFMNRSYGSNPFVRQGGKAAFTLGHSQGLIEGILLSFGMAYTLIPPRTWQKVIEDVIIPTDIRISNKKMKDTKVKSFIRVRELFPNAPLQTSRGRVLDGIADAILIAYWGALQSQRSPTLCYDMVEEPKRKRRQSNDKRTSK